MILKIVHVCIGAFYPDGYSYQENMLPRFHKKLGHDVYVIAGLDVFDENGKTIWLDKGKKYIGDYGVPVIRLDFKGIRSLARKFKNYKNLFDTLKSIEPDIIFVHNCQFICINQVVKYLKAHPEVRCYVDNHADFSNSATNWISRNILHGIVWKRCAKLIAPFTRKFYGVLPARVDFLVNVYGLPREQCELLVMGADDDLVEACSLNSNKIRIREKYGIKETDLLIVTGGKINHYRPETITLLKAVCDINLPNVKLLFFGNVDDEYINEFNTLSKNPHIINVGWISSRETYDFFHASDLVVFPGLHSVMWEQAVAQGKPCLFRDIDGFHHVDLGGNAAFMSDLSIEGIKYSILSVINDIDHLKHMTCIAEDKGKKTFSYKNIALRCIEL